MNAKTTRSALRASLNAEDASIEKRLPATPKAPARRKPALAEKEAAPAPAPKRKATVAKASTAAAPAAKPAAVRVSKPRAKPVAAAEVVAAAPPPAAAAVAPAPAKRARPAARSAPELPAAVAPESKPEKPKVEKVMRDSFSMPKSEHADLKSLRSDLARKGRISTKSELLRAGLRLLLALKPQDAIRLLEGLPVVPKGKTPKK